jgi:hypothetical protein
MIVISIDPGLTGAVAFLGDNWVKVVDLPTAPIETEGKIKRRTCGPRLQELLLANIPDGETDVHAVMEMLSVGGQHDVEKKQNLLISQGRTVGVIECLLECMGLDVARVYAQSWKRFYGLGGKQTDGENPEARARELATTLYPSLGLDLRRGCDHNRAEAVLIGHFFRKTRL